MFVEDLLTALIANEKEKAIDVQSANVSLETFVRSLERRPISAQERKLIQTEALAFLKVNGINIEEKLPQKLSERLGYSFLPLVSTLDLPEQETDDSKNIDQLAMAGINGKVASGITPYNYPGLSTQPARPGLYYMCSVRRIRSTLSTSYKMYLDCVKDLNNIGDVNNVRFGTKPSSGSLMILGARKMKSGIALMWADLEDVKDWKDRTSVGRVFRSNQGNYSGRLNGHSHQQSSSIISSGSASSVQSPTATRPGSPETTASAWTGGFGRNGAAAAAVDESVSQALPLVRSTTASQLSGPIVCAMRSKGMDKLIHVAAVASASAELEEGALQSLLESINTAASLASQTGAGGSTGSSGGMGSSGSRIGTASSAAAVPAGAVPLPPLPPGCIRLHSKLPRRVAEGRKGLHSVAFGKASRVRAPSRKNIVIDRVLDEGTANNEWLDDSNRPPIFQVGTSISGPLLLVRAIIQREMHPLRRLFHAFNIQHSQFNSISFC
jgi:hypothetical protein